LKLLFDNNLSIKLPEILDNFPGSKHVQQLGIESKMDQEIWEFAKSNGFNIVTKDKDFYHLSIRFSHPPKVVWVALGNCRNQEIINLLLEKMDVIIDFEKSNQDILVLT